MQDATLEVAPMNLASTPTKRHWTPHDFWDYELDRGLLENERTRGLTPEQWRCVLRVCQRGRRAAQELGPRGLADALAHELEGADTYVVCAVEAVMAAQAARGFLAVDIAELDRRLEQVDR